MADNRLQAVDIPARDVRVGMFLVSGATKKTYEITEVIPLSGTWVKIYTDNKSMNTTKHVDEVVHVAIEGFEF